MYKFFQVHLILRNSQLCKFLIHNSFIICKIRILKINLIFQKLKTQRILIYFHDKIFKFLIIFLVSPTNNYKSWLLDLIILKAAKITKVRKIEVQEQEFVFCCFRFRFCSRNNTGTFSIIENVSSEQN